jgi:hypothetical protein
MCYQIRRQLSALSPGAHAAAGTPVGTVGKSGHKPALSHHARPLRCRHGPRATSHESRATSDQLGAPSFELRGCSPASGKRRRPTGRESLLLSWLLGCASDADAGAGRRWQTLAGNSPPSHALCNVLGADLVGSLPAKCWESLCRMCQFGASAWPDVDVRQARLQAERIPACAWPGMGC